MEEQQEQQEEEEEEEDGRIVMRVSGYLSLEFSAFDQRENGTRTGFTKSVIVVTVFLVSCQFFSSINELLDFLFVSLKFFVFFILLF